MNKGQLNDKNFLKLSGLILESFYSRILGWEARVRGGNPKSYLASILNFGYDLKVIAIQVGITPVAFGYMSLNCMTKNSTSLYRVTYAEVA